ncbi:MAG: tsaB [Hyphomicrobiales bacterium]|nr:tsaB [Hyphomicrobiales bacterium]
MKILAIDTAHPAVSVCLLSGQLGELLALETMPMVRGHSEALLPLIERVMAASGLAFDALDRIAVVVGPGSFTGIRIGIAAARAIGLACDIPVVGVSSLSAFAAPLIGRSGGAVIAAGVDAKHGHIYVQGYGPQGQNILAPRLATVRDAVRALGSGPLQLTGSGAPMMAIEAWSMGIEADVVGQTVAPDIAFVAHLGTLADPSKNLARPYYLKPPDAQPQTKGLIARVTS